MPLKKVLKKLGRVAKLSVPKEKFKYIIEHVDTDGDGKHDDDHDGILVKKFAVKANNSLVFVNQKFIDNKRVREIFGNLQEFLMNNPHYSLHNNKEVKVVSEDDIIKYESGKKHIPHNQNIIVQDNTSFGQNLKTGLAQGIGLAVAFEAVDAVFDGIF